MVENRSPAVFRFGVFEVDLRAGELRKQGVRIKIQEQPFLVLTILLHRPGELVTRDELRSQIWHSDTFVDFNNGLNTSINRLRDAIGDSADNPRFVETIPKRGYRFIAPVTAVVQPAMPIEGAKATEARVPGWRRGRIPVFISLLAVAMLVGGLYYRARAARGLTDKDTIVIADFANKTGDTVFDDTLRQALAAQLDQSPFLSIVSDQAVHETLSLMGRPKNEPMAHDVSREVCLRLGCKAMVAGRIASLGSHYAISLSAINCPTGDYIAQEQVEASGKEAVLQALGTAATSLRRKLGESLASIRQFDTPILQATTPSLEALKAYSLAVRLHNEKGASAAIPLYQRAISLDPDFAAAYAGLGVSYANIGQSGAAIENLNKAFERRERVSEREKLSISSTYYLVLGDLNQASQAFELLAQTYPRDDHPHMNLGVGYFFLGQHEKAVAEAREALRLGPNRPISYSNMAQFDLALNRFTEANAIIEQALADNHDFYVLHLSLYELGFLRGDAVAMQRQVAWAAGKAGIEDLMSSTESDTEAFAGHLKNSRRLSRRAVESALRSNLKETAALWQANAALREAEFGNTTEARDGAAAALNLAPGRDVRMVAALALARSGEVALAQAIVDELARAYPSSTVLNVYWLPVLRSAIALDHRNSSRAIELLQPTAPYELGVPRPFRLGTLYPVYLHGQADLLAHQGGAAQAEFQKILDHRGVVLNFPLGALTHLGLARAQARQGDGAKARAAYQNFLALWKDADPDIPVLRQAQTEFARLGR